MAKRRRKKEEKSKQNDSDGGYLRATLARRLDSNPDSGLSFKM
jgi:hypothetical protein